YMNNIVWTTLGLQFHDKGDTIIFSKDKNSAKLLSYRWKLLKNEKDDFDGVVRENSPILTDYKVNKLVITKVTRDKKANYYLSLRAYGSTLNVGEKGAIILFSDGTKLEKQLADIDVNVSDIDLSNIQYEYSAYIPI
ncbi:MAG: hypothetical protein ACK43K_02830, partial [Chitinophagales bacterium]